MRIIVAYINSSQADLPNWHHATPPHARTDRYSRVCRARANSSTARSFSLPTGLQKNAKQENRASDVMSLNYCESSRGNRAVRAPQSRVERRLKGGPKGPDEASEHGVRRPRAGPTLRSPAGPIASARRPSEPYSPISKKKCQALPHLAFLQLTTTATTHQRSARTFLKDSHGRQGFAFQEFQERATTCGDIADLVSDRVFGDGSQRVATACDRKRR